MCPAQSSPCKETQTQKTLTLRPYQLEDIAFLKTKYCAACFNEPRTGKTPTAIKTFTEQDITKILVVCPTSAIIQWATEFTRWTNLPAYPVIGTPTKKRKTIDAWNNGALILSYDSLKQTKSNEGLVNDVLIKKPQGVILDEAHRIKNPKSANAQAAFMLSHHIPRRLALTGTPAPNKPHEVWSILHFLYPNSFSSYWRFINDFFETKVVKLGNHTFKEIGGVRKSKLKALQELLNQVATQRKRKDVMPWLPEKDKQRIMLKPTTEQKRYLNELQTYFETEDVVTQGTLDRLIRYRQICVHPATLGLKGKSPKTVWIKQYLKDYPEQPTIIFSKFTKYLKILSEEIATTPHALIIGETPVAKRQEIVDAFQTGALNLLLINVDAGKEALTLDAAKATIFTDKYPPVGDIEQAEDRFVATTEDKADKPHIIYELILEGTYDEQIYDLIEKRVEAIDVINNFKAHMLDTRKRGSK